VAACKIDREQQNDGTVFHSQHLPSTTRRVGKKGIGGFNHDYYYVIFPSRRRDREQQNDRTTE
jgi:hypothetical protein